MHQKVLKTAALIALEPSFRADLRRDALRLSPMAPELRAVAPELSPLEAELRPPSPVTHCIEVGSTRCF